MKPKILPALLSCFFLFFASCVNAQSGTLPLNGSVNGTLSSSTTTDTLNLTTTGDGLVRLTFQSTGARNEDLFVTLYDNNGTTVIAGPAESYINNLVILPVDGLSKGTYHVKVTAFSSGSVVGTYTLSDSLFTPAESNDVEPNNSRALADVLPLNVTTTGHVGYYYNNYKDTSDWYKVTTNADGLLRVTLSDARSSVYSTGYLDALVYLYDNDGVTQLGALEVQGGNTATGSISTDGLAAGTYYIKVQPYSTSGFAAYTLSDSLFTPAQPNDVEPNNSKATALTLPLNGSKTGHVGYYYNNYRDTSDWYKVTTNADGLLRFTLSAARSSVYSTNNLDVLVYLYDNDGVTQLGALEAEGSNPTASFSTDGLAAGTYYIKVQGYSPNTEFAAYTLSDSLFTYNPNDIEPNDSAYEATTILANRTTTGHILFYQNGGSRNASDWFKVNYTGSGNLQFNFDLLPHISDGATGDVFFQVYKDTTTAPIFNHEYYASQVKNTISLSSLTQGYYYIHIIPFNLTPAYFTAYSITDSFTQVNKATISLAKTSSPHSACGLDSLTFNLGSSHAPYTVRLYRDGVLTDSLITNSATAAFTGLNDGNYYATVYGDGATDSAYSKTGSTQLLPVTPSGLSATNIGAHSATLNFSKLSCEADYVIQYKITGTSTYTTVNVSGINGAYALAGLLTGTKYTFRLASSDPTNGLVSTYSDTATFTTLSDLPVTFLNFDGVLQDAKALLSWSTSQELNNKGFEVEKSYDGQTFTGIGFVNGAGNSSVVNTYNYTDLKVQSGSNYYRLRQEDIDGNFNYSATIRLDFKQFSWAIFGNPVTSASWIQLQLTKTTKVAIQILSVDGKVINVINKGTISEGTYSIPLNLGNAPAGIYIVRLLTDDGTFSKKITK